MTKLLAAILLVVVTMTGMAQTNPIAAARRIDWSQAGPAGGIPNRATQCGATIAAYTGPAATINNAITACPAGQVVQLGAGTFTLSSAIMFNGKSNVTLRGMGPDQTFIVFTGQTSCGGTTSVNSGICVKAGVTSYVGDPGNISNWTAGYAKDTTTLTLSSVTNLQVGAVLFLDILNDSTTDDNQIWICRTAPACCTDCATPSRTSDGVRSQIQATRVMAINGNNVTISPGVIWPNFGETGKTPQAWYASGPAIKGVGIEALSIDTGAIGGPGGSIFFYTAIDSWVRNVRVVHCKEKCIWIYQSVGVAVRDSYIFDKAGTDASQEGSEAYGIDAFLSSMWLIQNNIIHHINVPLMCESGVGGVAAYNYTFDNFYNLSSSDWAMGSSYTHGTCAYLLHEGNHGFGMEQDAVHGQNYFHTSFRNRYEGWESGKALQTVPIHIYASNRYANIIGNVLGTSTYHTKYESYPGSAANCDTSIYALGFGGNCGGGAMADKADVRSTAFRWGNWDTVNATTRFVSSEVPTGDANYPNSLPTDQNLPASLFLTSRPSWYPNRVPFPPIGPDVAGGNITNVGGHANSIPAKLCWDNGSKTTFDNGGGRAQPTLSAFNADNCYDRIPAPTNLRVVGARLLWTNPRSAEDDSRDVN
jgi:hypothetical protein